MRPVSGCVLGWVVVLFARIATAQPAAPPRAAADSAAAPSAPAAPTAGESATAAFPTPPPPEPATAPAPPPPSTSPQSASSFGQFGTGSDVAVPARRKSASDAESAPNLDTGWETRPGTMEEAPRRRFGDAGEFAMLTGSRFSLSSRGYTNSAAKGFGVGFAPSLEYFVVQDVSVGLELTIVYSSTRGYGATGAVGDQTYTFVGGGVHAGVNVPFSRALSLYPMLAVGVHHAVETIEVVRPGRTLTDPNSQTTPSLSLTGPWIGFSVPLLLHAAPNFFVGLGPSVYHDFANGTPPVGSWVERTQIGGSFLVGGWFGGRDPGGADRVAGDRVAAERKPPRFGGEGTAFISDESNFAVMATTYAGPAPTTTGFVIAPGADFFFRDNVSVGGAMTFADSTAHVVAADGLAVDRTRQSLGILGRFGVVVPLGSWASLYPRASLEYSSSGDSYSGSARPDAKTVTAALSVPFLVHAAGHFVAGIGPIASTDLSQSYSSGNPSVKQTIIGVTTVLGGWL